MDSETWVLRKRDEQRLEAAQMKFLRYLLGINKLGRETNQPVREKPRVRNTNTAISTKVATTPTENGHKQDTQTSIKL